MSIRFALAKGRVANQVIDVFEKLGYVFPDYSKDSRKLVFTDKTGEISFFLVKSPDVPVYVEKGTADVGIVGRDILLEHPADVYELLNLDIGKCRMCVAAYPETSFNYDTKIVVASKYPKIAQDYFNGLDQPTEMIYLGGSVELAPVLGLADCIVDIVETGNTLKENGLVVKDVLFDISSRLIVNKVSLKTKEGLLELIEKFEKI